MDLLQHTTLPIRLPELCRELVPNRYLPGNAQQDFTGCRLHIIRQAGAWQMQVLTHPQARDTMAAQLRPLLHKGCTIAAASRTIQLREGAKTELVQEDLTGTVQSALLQVIITTLPI